MGPGLLQIRTEDERSESDVRSMGHERRSLCRRRRRQRLGNFCLVALATLGRHVPNQGVLAVPLAAVFRPLDSSDAFPEAGQARPHEK
jgi:hypothetical protein